MGGNCSTSRWGHSCASRLRAKSLKLLQAITPRHLVELIEGVMAPDPERLALNLEIPAILQRSLAKIAERREFTLAVRV